MGHIELAVPVAHIWFVRGRDRVLSRLLGLSRQELESVIYYARHVVVAAGEGMPAVGTILTEEERDSYVARATLHGDTSFRVESGGRAIKQLLEAIDLPRLAQELERGLSNSRHADRKAAARRLSLIRKLLIPGSSGDVPSTPARMILDVLPVLPPGLRPLIRRSDGKYVSGDLNVLYRRVMHRNLRVGRLAKEGVPEVILRNAMRLLQEAVDELLANGMRSKALAGTGKRALCSLTESLVGKQGRLRKSLLGKRVDYSARAVIVPDPTLSLGQCGVPHTIAAEVFKPFLIRALLQQKAVASAPAASAMIEDWLQGRSVTTIRIPSAGKDDGQAPLPPSFVRLSTRPVEEILRSVVSNHPILLNRAPTLDRLGVRAFEAVLTDHKAIQLAPLACQGFAADFDGDTIGLHLPLSPEAKREATTLLAATKNLRSPRDGSPVIIPDKEMALGWWLATCLPPGVQEPKSETPVEWYGARRFSDVGEIEHALELGRVHARTPIWFRTEVAIRSGWVPTTVGRVLLNSALPSVVASSLGFINRTADRSLIADVVARSISNCGTGLTLRLVEELKESGFRWATAFGTSLAFQDLLSTEDRSVLLDSAVGMVKRLDGYADGGSLTRRSRYYLHLEIWKRAGELLTEQFLAGKKASATDNLLVGMYEAGVGLSRIELQHLVGMRGVMPRPRARLFGEVGEALPVVVRSSLAGGLSPIEFLMTVRGRRKGLVDVALRVSKAGHLMRRIASALQGVVIRQADCGTLDGLTIPLDTQTGERAIRGRVCASDVYSRGSAPLETPLALAGELIDREKARQLCEGGVHQVLVRSPLTCAATEGCCQQCYGAAVAGARIVPIGEAVGILAAQSFGEVSVQQALNSRREAGVREIPGWAEPRAALSGVVRYGPQVEIVEVPILRAGRRETVRVVLGTRPGSALEEPILTIEGTDASRSSQVMALRPGDRLLHQDGALVGPGTLVIEREPYYHVIVAPRDGELQWKDIVMGRSVRWRRELGNSRSLVVQRARRGELTPSVTISTQGSEEQYTIPLSPGTEIRLGSPWDDVWPLLQGGARGNPWSSAFESRPLDRGAALDRNFLSPPIPVRRGQVIGVLPASPRLSRDLSGALPDLASLLELAPSGKKGLLAEHDGKVELSEDDERVVVTVLPSAAAAGRMQVSYLPKRQRLLVHQGSEVSAGDLLSEGGVDWNALINILGPTRTLLRLTETIDRLCEQHGARISRKHIELLVRRLLQEEDGSARGRGPAPEELSETKGGSDLRLAGITRLALQGKSFMVRAAFQESVAALVDAALAGEVDQLKGLVENVMVGRLIPAGTGLLGNTGVNFIESVV